MIEWIIAIVAWIVGATVTVFGLGYYDGRKNNHDEIQAEHVWAIIIFWPFVWMCSITIVFRWAYDFGQSLATQKKEKKK